MNERRPPLSDADIERLLADCGDSLYVPDAPDMAQMMRVRLAGLPVPRSGPLVAELATSGSTPLEIDSTGYPPAPGHRGPRWWLGQGARYAGALAATLLVATVLVLAFRDSTDDGLPGMGGESGAPMQEVLFTVTVGDDGSSGDLTAFAAETLEELYSIEVGYNPDAVLSPDGATLYAVGDDELAAYDAATGTEIWRATVKYRMYYILGMGPSILGVSPNGEHVYMHSYDNAGDFGDYGANAGNIPTWVRVIDADTGTLLLDTEKIPGYCNAEIYSSADAKTIFQICTNGGITRAFDSETGGLVAHLGVTGASGSVQSKDGGEIYLVATRPRIVDTETAQILTPSGLDELRINGVQRGVVALAPDGERLFVGQEAQRQADGAYETQEIGVYGIDTWEEIGTVQLEQPVTGQSLASDSDGYVYASTTRYVDGTSIPLASDILKINPSDGSVSRRTLAGEEILRLFVGEVPVD